MQCSRSVSFEMRVLLRFHLSYLCSSLTCSPTTFYYFKLSPLKASLHMCGRSRRYKTTKWDMYTTWKLTRAWLPCVSSVMKHYNLVQHLWVMRLLQNNAVGLHTILNSNQYNVFQICSYSWGGTAQLKLNSYFIFGSSRTDRLISDQCQIKYRNRPCKFWLIAHCYGV